VAVRPGQLGGCGCTPPLVSVLLEVALVPAAVDAAPLVSVLLEVVVPADPGIRLLALADSGIRLLELAGRVAGILY
jgi:hypothetical protein